MLAAIIAGLYGCNYWRSEPLGPQIYIMPTNPPSPDRPATPAAKPAPIAEAPPGRLPDIDLRDRFKITVITCLAPKTHDTIIAVLKAWKFDNIGDRSQLIRSTADRFRNASSFSREDSVIFSRKQDKDVATRIAWLLNQSPALRKVSPRNYLPTLGDTPSDERDIYIHSGGEECPRGEAPGP